VSNVFPQNYFWEPIWLSLVGRRRYNGDFSQEELAKFGYTKYEVRIFNQPYIYIWLNAEKHIYKSAFFFLSLTFGDWKLLKALHFQILSFNSVFW